MTNPRISIHYFQSHGSRCEADLLLPDTSDKPPVLVMGVGYGSERGFGTHGLAQHLLENGIAVFRFDYRGFGGSDAIKGAPRQLVDPQQQLEDWQAALNYISQMEDIDSSRLSIWGSSFAGGHVISIAGSEWSKVFRIKAVVSQIPHLDSRSALKNVGIKTAMKGAWNGIKGALLNLTGINHTVPIVGKPDDEGFSVMQHAGWYEGYHRIAEGSDTWKNAIPAMSLLKAGSYNPIDYASNIDCPVLIVYGNQDAGIPVDDVQKTANRIPQVTLWEFEGDHFDAYDGGNVVSDVIKQEIDFLLHHLS